MDDATRKLLVKECKKHVNFLQGLHALGVTFGPVSPASLDRYLDLWLPLVAAASGTTATSISSNKGDCRHHQSLIPPPDIAWLWHCHRLAPLHYENYVTTRFGRLLEASPPFAFQQEHVDDGDENAAAARATRRAWHDRYPNHDFFYGYNHGHDNDVQSTTTTMWKNAEYLAMKESSSSNGFDLLASVASQSTFLWHISRPHYRQDDYLLEGVDNYLKFVQLSRRFVNPGDMIVPTFQIDLLWHTHILWSIPHYHALCLERRGSKFRHDDSFNDRTPGGSLEKAFAQTTALWTETYGTAYAVDGAMYHGEPDEAFYRNDWTPIVTHAASCKSKSQESRLQMVMLALVGILLAFAYSWNDGDISVLVGGKRHEPVVIPGAC